MFSEILVAFVIKNPINPSEMLCVHDQIQICSDASEKNLTSPQTFVSHAYDACDISVPVANSKWPIIGTEVLRDIMR